MAELRPVVRSLIACEDIQAVGVHGVTLVKLIHTVRPAEGSVYPLLRPVLCVFAQLTECRGTARIRVEIRHADTDTVLFRTAEHTARFRAEPLILHGVRFRILNCGFPAPGLYWVQLWYNDFVVAETPITLIP